MPTTQFCVAVVMLITVDAATLRGGKRTVADDTVTLEYMMEHEMSPLLIPITSAEGATRLRSPGNDNNNTFFALESLQTQRTQTWCSIATLATAIRAIPGLAVGATAAAVSPYTPYNYWDQEMLEKTECA